MSKLPLSQIIPFLKCVQIKKTRALYLVFEGKYLNFNSCTFLENFGYTYCADCSRVNSKKQGQILP